MSSLNQHTAATNSQFLQQWGNIVNPYLNPYLSPVAAAPPYWNVPEYTATTTSMHVPVLPVLPVPTLLPTPLPLLPTPIKMQTSLQKKGQNCQKLQAQEDQNNLKKSFLLKEQLKQQHLKSLFQDAFMKQTSAAPRLQDPLWLVYCHFNNYLDMAKKSFQEQQISMFALQNQMFTAASEYVDYHKEAEGEDKFYECNESDEKTKSKPRTTKRRERESEKITSKERKDKKTKRRKDKKEKEKTQQVVQEPQQINTQEEVNTQIDIRIAEVDTQQNAQVQVDTQQQEEQLQENVPQEEQLQENVPKEQLHCCQVLLYQTQEEQLYQTQEEQQQQFDQQQLCEQREQTNQQLEQQTEKQNEEQTSQQESEQQNEQQNEEEEAFFSQKREEQKNLEELVQQNNNDEFSSCDQEGKQEEEFFQYSGEEEEEEFLQREEGQIRAREQEDYPDQDREKESEEKQKVFLEEEGELVQRYVADSSNYNHHQQRNLHYYQNNHHRNLNREKVWTDEQPAQVPSSYFPYSEVLINLETRYIFIARTVLCVMAFALKRIFSPSPEEAQVCDNFMKKYEYIQEYFNQYMNALRVSASLEEAGNKAEFRHRTYVLGRIYTCLKWIVSSTMLVCLQSIQSYRFLYYRHRKQTPSNADGTFSDLQKNINLFHSSITIMNNDNVKTIFQGFLRVIDATFHTGKTYSDSCYISLEVCYNLLTTLFVREQMKQCSNDFLPLLEHLKIAIQMQKEKQVQKKKQQKQESEREYKPYCDQEHYQKCYEQRQRQWWQQRQRQWWQQQKRSGNNSREQEKSYKYERKSDDKHEQKSEEPRGCRQEQRQRGQTTPKFTIRTIRKRRKPCIVKKPYIV